MHVHLARKVSCEIHSFGGLRRENMWIAPRKLVNCTKKICGLHQENVWIAPRKFVDCTKKIGGSH